MQGQLGFPENGDAAIHSPFFAILPSRTDAWRIARRGRDLRRAAGLSGPLVSADRLHISLHGFGFHRSLPEHLLRVASQAGEAVTFPEFEVTFDCVGSFRGGADGKFPFVLRSRDDIDALHLFHRALAAAMTRAGLSRWIASQFTPHMTLLYDTRFVRPCGISGVQFRVREFVLVDSLVGQRRHVPIARWRLGAHQVRRSTSCRRMR